jgi:hypothetical protein
MRARFNPTGLSISMEDADIDKVELECIVKGFNNPILLLQINDLVVKYGRESPGFHIETVPDNLSFELCKEIYVFIDIQIHHQVFFEYDAEFRGGFFITRSAYDRVDISYYSPEKHGNKF